MTKTTWTLRSSEVPQSLLSACVENKLSVSVLSHNNVEICGNHKDLKHVFSALKQDPNIEHVFGINPNEMRLHHYNHFADPRAIAESFTPIELATLYNFPQSSGETQVIGIIELGGGYELNDILTYLKSLGITEIPNITDVSVNGGANNPNDPDEGATMEVILDLEIVVALVPRAAIRVYFAPNSGTGFYNAILQASMDKCNVISISWGNREELWDSSALTAFDNLFTESTSIIFCASGDAGSSDGGDSNTLHVDFPASSPHAIGCGGTEVIAEDGQIISETVWNNNSQTEATGGGVSKVFLIPSYQAHLDALAGFRGVPDVSANADNRTPYKLYAQRFGGTFYAGGTSAVSPMWSGLLARVQTLSNNAVPKKSVLDIMYANRSVFNDVLVGNNGYYSAQVGWDATTGNGSPKGVALLRLFADYVDPPVEVAVQKPFPVWAIALIVVVAVLVLIGVGLLGYFINKQARRV